VQGAALGREPAVRALLKAPPRAPYVAEALGAAGQSVSIELANAGPSPVNVARLSADFAATRDGVPFPCKKRVGASMGRHEPATLAPGQAFVFERDLDCTMPLPGRYDIAVYVTFGDADEPPDLVGRFALEVEDHALAPRPYPTRPGLYVAMVGDRATRPLSREAWARGDYHVVLAVVNGSARPVPVGPARLSFTTYRKGSTLPCSGQAESVDLPDELAPGAMYVMQKAVACAPSEQGQYEIVGHLTFGKSSDEIEVGRVSLKVTLDPFLFTPGPWPPVGARPSSWVR
jgi:hypothetical protein